MPKYKPTSKSGWDADNESKEPERREQKIMRVVQSIAAFVQDTVEAKFRERQYSNIVESHKSDPGTAEHNEDWAQSVVTEQSPKRDIGPNQCPSSVGRRPRNSPSYDDDAESDRVASSMHQRRHPTPAAGTESAKRRRPTQKEQESMESPPWSRGWQASMSSLESPPKKRTESSVEDGREKNKTDIQAGLLCNPKPGFPLPHTFVNGQNLNNHEYMPNGHYNTTQGMQYVTVPKLRPTPPEGPPPAYLREVNYNLADKSSRPIACPTIRPIRKTGKPRRNAVVTAIPKAVVTANGDLNDLYGQLSYVWVRISDMADTVNLPDDLRKHGAMVLVVEFTTEAHEAHELVIDLANELQKPSVGLDRTNRKNRKEGGERAARQYDCFLFNKAIVGYRKNDQIVDMTEVLDVEDMHTAERMKVFRLRLTRHICGHEEIKFAVPLAGWAMDGDRIDEPQVRADVKFLIDNRVRTVFGNDAVDPHNQIIDALKHTARIYTIRQHDDDAYIMCIGELHRGIRTAMNAEEAVIWNNKESLCQGNIYLEWPRLEDRHWKPVQCVDYKKAPDPPEGISKVWIFWGATRSNRSQRELKERANRTWRKHLLRNPVVTGVRYTKPPPKKRRRIRGKGK